MYKSKLTLLIALGLLALLFSCDNRKDYILDLNNAPSITIRKTGTSAYASSVTDSLNLDNPVYTCDYTITDEKVSTVKVTSNYIGSGTSQLNLTDKKVTITPSAPGQQSLTLTATDQFGKSSSCYISLTVFSKAPYLTVRKSGTFNAYAGGVTDSFKLENLTYSCDYLFTDENVQTVTVTSSYNIGSGTTQLNLPNKKLIISPVTPGQQNITLTAIDQYGNVSNICNISLTAFANLLPVAMVNVIQTNTNSSFEVNIDASNSYDQDAHFGGYIAEYEYKVGTNYIVTTALSNINYIFPSAGNYTINVRVKDNNGGWSATKTTNITVM